MTSYDFVGRKKVVAEGHDENTITKLYTARRNKTETISLVGAQRWIVVLFL